MDINSKINMSLDEIIKLKRANNKAEKKGAPAKGPKGRGKAKFGKPTKDAGPSRKGENGAGRRFQKNKRVFTPSTNSPARATPMKRGAKNAKAAAKKQATTVNLNKAATKRLVQNLVKKALKTTNARKVVAPARARLTTRNMRKRITAPAVVSSPRNRTIASRLGRVSNQSRVIRRPVRVVTRSPRAVIQRTVTQRSPRAVVVRGRGTPRYNQGGQQRVVQVVERPRAPVVVRRQRVAAPVNYRYVDRAPQESVIVRRVPAQRPRYVERVEERPIQRRVVYVERPRPQTQRVFVRNVPRNEGRFASSNAFLPEVVVRRGRGFNGRR